MTMHGRHTSKHRKLTARRRHLAALAVGLGVAAATGHDVAWADTVASSDHPSGNPTSGVNAGPKKPDDVAKPTKSTTLGGTAGDPISAGINAAAKSLTTTLSKLTAPLHDSARNAPIVRLQSRDGDTTKETSLSRTVSRSLPARFASRQLGQSATALSTAAQRPEAVAAATDTLAPATTTQTAKTVAAAASSITSIAPDPPGPLSPIEKVIAAPGRFVNVVLQALDITTSSKGPQSPIDFDPIDEALFAAFRRFEGVLGLDTPPAVQPVISHQQYTLPENPQKTPTVAQFLNAAAGEYVLGGSPAGLKPFTVDGKQMTSTNLLTGESGKAWVTPDGQIIIAYQGTTGGTNLLFNPLIAVSQIATDLQIIFTDDTPQAFHDSLAFERRVEAAAAEQGYERKDIFVTGHSLGAWEAQYVAQQTPGLGGGIGFEGPGINTVVPGNGVDSGFVNVETYGDTAAYFSTDLPGLQPFMPAYVPGDLGGGSKPHYGSIIMIGDPNAAIPLSNAASLFGPNPIGLGIFAIDILGNFFQYHLPGVQAHYLDVRPDPGVVPWLGYATGTVNEGWGELTIPELKAAASDAGVLIVP